MGTISEGISLHYEKFDKSIIISMYNDKLKYKIGVNIDNTKYVNYGMLSFFLK